MGSNRGWLSRLVWSGVVGTTVVVLSTLLLLIIGSANPSQAQDVASDIVGIPLLPGVGLASIFFGSWQAFHQGQIAPGPPVSIVIVVDLLIIFVTGSLYTAGDLRRRMFTLRCISTGEFGGGGSCGIRYDFDGATQTFVFLCSGRGDCQHDGRSASRFFGKSRELRRRRRSPVLFVGNTACTGLVSDKGNV
jgi:hypothetical protein